MGEAFLPGLVKVIEERLGRLGKPVSTIFVLLLVLGIGAWMLDLFIGKVVLPIANFLDDVISSQTFEIDVGSTITIVVVLVFTTLIIAGFSWWINRRLNDMGFKVSATGRFISHVSKRNEESVQELSQELSQLQETSKTSKGEISTLQEFDGELLRLSNKMLDHFDERLQKLEGSLRLSAPGTEASEPPGA